MMKTLVNILIIYLIYFTSGMQPVPEPDSDISLKIKKDTVEYFNEDKFAEIPLDIQVNNNDKIYFVYNTTAEAIFPNTLQEYKNCHKNKFNCKFMYLLTSISDSVILPNNFARMDCKINDTLLNNNKYGYRFFKLFNINSEDFVLQINICGFYYLKKGYYKMYLSYYASSEYPHPWLQQYLKYKDIKWEEVYTYKEKYIGSFILHVKG